MSDIGIDDVIRLETQVWQALVDGNVEADQRMLSEDFLGVYPAASPTGASTPRHSLTAPLSRHSS